MPRRHLIVRLDGIPEVAMASSLARRIRAEEPDAHIAWLCGRSTMELVRLFPEVDRVHVLNDLALRRWNPARRLAVLARIGPKLMVRRYHRVYLLHEGRSYRALVPGLRRWRVRGFGRKYGRMLPIPGRFFGDECARLYDGRQHEGPIKGHYPLAEVRGDLPELPRRVGGGLEHAVVLAPGGPPDEKRQQLLTRWPVASYADLAETFMREGRPVVLVGDGDPEWLRPAFAGLPVRNLVGSLSTAETLRLMMQAGAVVTHDEGPMHLARLARAHLVALFGPTRPGERLVPDEKTTVIWGGEDLACRPCFDGRAFARCEANICISRVRVREVEDAVRARLERSDAE